MSESYECWAVMEKDKPFQNFSYTPRPSGPHDVDVKIICCGICASDIHQVTSGWGRTQYPIVPGHEIVGRVVAVGNEVTKFNVGDRVGVGCVVLSCFNCEQCNICDEQYCSKGRVFTYNDKYPDGNLTYGGYSKNIRVHDHFVFLKSLIILIRFLLLLYFVLVLLFLNL